MTDSIRTQTRVEVDDEIAVELVPNGEWMGDTTLRTLRIGGTDDLIIQGDVHQLMDTAASAIWALARSTDGTHGGVYNTADTLLLAVRDLLEKYAEVNAGEMGDDNVNRIHGACAEIGAAASRARVEIESPFASAMGGF